MTYTIIVNETEHSAFDWHEVPMPEAGDAPSHGHSRNADLLEEGVSEMATGEVSFTCDLTFVFDTTLELKGDGRKFVVIQSDSGRHIAKPY